ncbi:hypothetical protein M0804_011309 [Polistes exclamans]|nr:hypothetical protein M0804_011309 [Polistes exclamans]
MIIDFSFIFWIRFTKIKFGQLNNVLKNMLTSTNDIPQHKRVLRMKDNWEDDSLLSTIYYTYKANENYIKLKIIRNQLFIFAQDNESKVAQIISEFQLIGNTIIYATSIFVGIMKSIILTDVIWIPYINTLINDKYLVPQFLYFDNYPYFVTLIIEFTFIFWILYIKIKFGQLNVALKSMLTTTVNSPQHKRVFRMKDNWEDDSSLSIIYRTYKTNENYIKLKKMKCIKSGFQRANELLGDVEILPISSIASELNDERTKMNDLFINKRLFPINSTKLFITLPSSLHRTQSRLQIVTTKQNKSRTLLRTIRQVHLELFKLSKELSKMYGIQVSLEISMCILFGIFVLYHFYTQYLRQSYDIEKNFVQLILTFLSMIQLAVKIFIINYTCEKTTEEAENTNEILHTFYGQNTNLKIKNEVDIFTLQMMQHRTEYSAYGFFKLNCKYICSCIGTVTTYIVIMIQVTDSIKEVS